MRQRSLISLSARRVPPCVGALAIAMAAACVFAVGAPVQAAPAAVSAQPVASTARAEDTALARAKASGMPVVVDALTTPDAMVTANPTGTLTLIQTLQPTRVKQGRTWVNLDATLRRDTDGRVSPRATGGGVMLSGGGSGPLAVLTNAGHSLSLGWPTPLPVPVLSGAQADYPGVLPGVGLDVTVTVQGGLQQVLVVHNAAAAANPALAALRMRLAGTELHVTQDATGTLTAAASDHGLPLFTAAAPIMWDSAGHTTALSDVAGPSHAAHTATVGTALTGSAPASGASTLTLSPNTAMLTSPSTVFPVYIDPAWSPLPAGGARQAWGSVSTLYPGNNEYDNSTDPDASILQVGNSSYYTARSFIRFGVSAVLDGATIYSSDVKFTSAGDVCKSSATNVDLYWTGPIRNPLTWNNMPGMSDKIASASGTDCPNTSVDFNVTSFMQTHVGATSMTFGLRAPDESDNTQWKEFWSKNGAASMSTEYNTPPDCPACLPPHPVGSATPAAPPRSLSAMTTSPSRSFPTTSTADYSAPSSYQELPNGTTVYDSGPPPPRSPA